MCDGSFMLIRTDITKFTKTGRFEVSARLWVPFQARFITTNFLRADLLNMMFPTKITIPAKASLVILAMRRFHLQFCWLWPFHYWQDYLVSSKLEGILGYQGYIRIVTDWPQYLNDNQSLVRTRAKQDLLLWLHPDASKCSFDGPNPCCLLSCSSW